jgi:hypothetical protein
MEPTDRPLMSCWRKYCMGGFRVQGSGFREEEESGIFFS